MVKGILQLSKKLVLKIYKKKQLTEAEESGKLIWLSQRNDSFEETT